MRLLPKYIKNDEQKDAFIAMLLYISCTSIFFLYEQRLIHSDLKIIFFFSKITLIILALPVMFYLTRKPKSSLHHFLVCLLVTLFSVVGELFSPLYFFAFIVCTLGIILFYRPKPIIFFPVILFGGISILTIQFQKSQGAFPLAREEDIGDYIIIFVEFFAIFFYLFKGHSITRQNEMEFRERFSLIGNELNIFAHNIKGLLSSQFIIVDNIEDGLRRNIDIKESVESAQKNLNDIHLYLNSFNLIANTNLQSIQIFDAVEKVIQLLKISPNQYKIEGARKKSINIIQQDFESILISILSNSVKALASSQNDSHKIFIRILEDKLTINSPFSSQYKSNSGIGEKIATSLAEKHDLRLTSFYNDSLYETTLDYSKIASVPGY